MLIINWLLPNTCGIYVVLPSQLMMPASYRCKHSPPNRRESIEYIFNILVGIWRMWLSLTFMYFLPEEHNKINKCMTQKVPEGTPMTVPGKYTYSVKSPWRFTQQSKHVCKNVPTFNICLYHGICLITQYALFVNQLPWWPLFVVFTHTHDSNFNNLIFLFTLRNRIKSETCFQPGRALHIYILAEPPAGEGRDKFPLLGPLGFEPGTPHTLSECSTNWAMSPSHVLGQTEIKWWKNIIFMLTVKHRHRILHFFKYCPKLMYKQHLKPITCLSVAIKLMYFGYARLGSGLFDIYGWGNWPSQKFLTSGL